MNFIYFMNNILDQFADDVTEINISYKKIVGILDFKRFTKLVKLICYDNFITSLDNLPSSLKELYCDDTVNDYDKLMKKYNKQ